MLLRTLYSLFVPGGVLLLLAAVGLQLGFLSHWGPEVFPVLPVTVAVGGFLLGWRFHRSALVLGLLVLVGIDRGLTSQVFASHTVPVLSILLPLNFVVLAFSKERGLMNSHGLIRMVGLLLQIPVVLVLLHFWSVEIQGLLQQEFISLKWQPPLSQSVLLAHGSGLLILGMRLVWKRTPMDVGFFWSLATCTLALGTLDHPPLPTLLFTTAGLILVVSVIEASYGMAFRDELTGLPGRRALEEALLRLGPRFTVAMVDIDHFKRFNDRHGHDVGDQVLRMVATRLGKVTGGGKSFRYGGEEFAILFPDRELDETLPHLKRVLKNVADVEFVVRGKGRPKRKPKPASKTTRKKAARKAAVKKTSRASKTRPAHTKGKITVSIGAAETSEKRSLPQEVIRAADAALYKAKRGGRNRVCS